MQRSPYFWVAALFIPMAMVIYVATGDLACRPCRSGAGAVGREKIPALAPRGLPCGEPVCSFAGCPGDCHGKIVVAVPDPLRRHQLHPHQPSPTMSEPIVAQKFPYVKDMAPGTYYWCACGGSKNQPFCDGSHKGTTFTPVQVVLAAPRKVAFCGCKHSGNGAFCDGSHAKL